MDKFSPSYVHSIITDADDCAWPVDPQGLNQCDFAATANALNLLLGERRYNQNLLVREAGPLYQPQLGGTISPLKAWQLRRRGFGTHFGNLSRTDYEAVLRELIDMRVPTIIELGVAFQIGRIAIYGRHSVVLVGYSEPYQDATSQICEEYYTVDSLWPINGAFTLRSNDTDRSGDGIAESYPGNRTLSRAEFRALFRTGLYYPIFCTQAEHDRWYTARLKSITRFPVIGWINQEMFTGSYDMLRK